MIGGTADLLVPPSRRETVAASASEDVADSTLASGMSTESEPVSMASAAASSESGCRARCASRCAVGSPPRTLTRLARTAALSVVKNVTAPGTRVVRGAMPSATAL